MTSKYHRMDITLRARRAVQIKEGKWDPAYQYLPYADLKRLNIAEEITVGADIEIEIVTLYPDSACRVAKAVLAATGRPAALSIESVEGRSGFPLIYTYISTTSTFDPTGKDLFEAWSEAGKAEGMINK